MMTEVCGTYEWSDDERRVVEQYGHLFIKRRDYSEPAVSSEPPTPHERPPRAELTRRRERTPPPRKGRGKAHAGGGVRVTGRTAFGQ